MAIQSQFPLGLLDAPHQERIKYFSEKKIKHTHLAKAHKKLTTIIRNGDPSQLVMIYGPTGVGKTTLVNRLIQDLRHQPDIGPGRIPVAYVEAIAPSSGSFDWRDYYYRCLQSLDEPLIDRKLDPNTVVARREKIGSFVLPRKPTTSDLRKALELALIHRCPDAFFVDEAQHLKKVASGKCLIDQMDTIKSIANTSRTKHVLVGTYELLGLTGLSAQLNRRTTEVHLQRYRYQNKEEFEEYINILVNFELSMPVEERPKLSLFPEEIYKGAPGCVGILKDWLMRSLILALDCNDKTVTIEHLLETKLPDRQMATIAREIREGEMLLCEDRADEIYFLLGMSPDAPKDKSKINEPKRKGRQRPGERAPKRDPIGVNVVSV